MAEKALAWAEAAAAADKNPQMNKAERERFEAAGWRVGAAADRLHS